MKDIPNALIGIRKRGIVAGEKNGNKGIVADGKHGNMPEMLPKVEICRECYKRWKTARDVAKNGNTPGMLRKVKICSGWCEKWAWAEVDNCPGVCYNKHP